MRILVLALALLPTAAIAQERAPARPPVFAGKPLCADANPQWTGAARKPARVQKLGEEPAAGQYLGVLRIEDGCDRPVKIRDGIGDDAADQR